MAQAEPNVIVSASSSGGEDDGGAARVAQRSGKGEEFMSAEEAFASSSECFGSAYSTVGMSDDEIARGIQNSRAQGMWSDLKQRGEGAAGPRCDGADALVWEQLKRMHWATFYDLEKCKLKLGRKIAEGAQAQIYEASWRFVFEGFAEGAHASWRYGFGGVAKVFNMEGFSLSDFKRLVPRGGSEYYYKKYDDYDDNVDGLGRLIFNCHLTHCSQILFATILEDGRFAFAMSRGWGDLRTLINLRWEDNNNNIRQSSFRSYLPLNIMWNIARGIRALHSPGALQEDLKRPFEPYLALNIMGNIARGIRSLHYQGALHRDMKAANVPIFPSKGHDPRYDDRFYCSVADYESAMFVKGTGFWRASEVLEELMKQPCDRTNDIWTEKVDAYSYGMTCYEVLTGHIPFFGYVGKEDQKRVINGERPHLPGYIDSRVQDLVKSCWEKEPQRRPDFKLILAILESIGYDESSMPKHEHLCFPGLGICSERGRYAFKVSS